MSLFLKRITDIQLIRGFIYFLLNYFLFKRIRFPLRVYKHASIYNKWNIVMGKGVVVPEKAYISPVELEVGDYSWLGVNSFICGKVKIGSYVSIGPNVVIPGAEHNIDNPEKPIRMSGNKIIGTIIEDNVWIGANSVILDGVTIGEGAVIGAGSVVTKNVSRNSIVYGNAASEKSKRIL